MTSPFLADFDRGGRCNRNGCLPPVKACERYYLIERLAELGMLPVYSMPEDVFDE